jgi:hypothetical protein
MSKELGGLQPRIPIDHDIVFADEERDVEELAASFHGPGYAGNGADFYRCAMN